MATHPVAAAADVDDDGVVDEAVDDSAGDDLVGEDLKAAYKLTAKQARHAALSTAKAKAAAALVKSDANPDGYEAPKFGYAFNQVVGELRNSSIPNPAAIAALVPLAMPFHPRLRTRVVMALKNAGELLRRADNGELSIRGLSGLRVPLPPLAPFQHTAPTAS